MRLNREQYAMIAEIKERSRRVYRTSLAVGKRGIIRDPELADLYMDGQFLAKFAEMLWRASGDQARAEHADDQEQQRHERLAEDTQDWLDQSPAELPPSEDDQVADLP